MNTNKNKLINLIVNILASVILILSFLMPLDKGFPEITIFPNLSTHLVHVLILSLFVLLFFKEKLYKNYLKIFKENCSYLSSQIIIIFLFAASIRNPVAKEGFVSLILYFCIFVIGFLDFTILLKNSETKKILIIVAIVSASLAALIGIYEFITRSYPEPYRYFIAITDGLDELHLDAVEKLFLAKGTQGSHLNYGFLMGLSILLTPFIKNKKARIFYLMLIILGCLTGGSTTGFITLTILGFNLFFAFFSSKNWNNLKKIFPKIIAIILLIVLISSLIFPSLVKNTASLLKRIVFGNPDSIDQRLARINWTFNKLNYFAKNNIAKFLIGNGFKSSHAAFAKDFPVPSWWPVGTGRVFNLDNEYLVDLYELGIIGTIIFIFAWFRLLAIYKLEDFRWWLIFAYIIGFLSMEFLSISAINVILIFLFALWKDPLKNSLTDSNSSQATPF